MATRVNLVRVGDCLKQLERIESGSVDLVFADPPFNIGYEYDVYDDRRSRREYVAWSAKWMKRVFKALKPNGTFWLAIGDEYAAHLRILAEDEVGFRCRSWVIWYYTFGVNCVRGFSRSHTHLFHFVKDPDDFTFHSENPAVRVPSARQLVYADARANQRGRLPDNTWIIRPQDGPPNAFAPHHDTWFYSRVAGTFKEREGFHGCQMPEQLLGRIIRVSSRPSDLVLDPFSGSGTTLAVAKKLGRRWLGIELSPEYVKHINTRLRRIQVGDPLEGPADPVASAPKTSRGRRRTRFHNGQPLPEATEETRTGILEAYHEAGDDCSTDWLLCDPDKNAQFLAACKRRSLPGGAYLWNRLLLRMRKSGVLKASGKRPRRMTFEQMDPFSFASEVAMQIMSVDYGLSLDDVLCHPHGVREFDQLAERMAPGYTPLEYRWAALAIRKRATRSRKLAATRFASWRKKSIPRAKPLNSFTSAEYEAPGVYVVRAAKQALYVGETTNLRRRMEPLGNDDSWSNLGMSAVAFIPLDDAERHGLQSLLVERLSPLLNSRMLRPEPS